MSIINLLRCIGNLIISLIHILLYYYALFIRIFLENSNALPVVTSKVLYFPNLLIELFNTSRTLGIY